MISRSVVAGSEAVAIGTFNLDAALAHVRGIAAQLPAFTTDDAWEHMQFDGDRRSIANAFIRAEREGIIRNSHIGAYARGRQAHRRWLTIWLSVSLEGTIHDAAAYAEAVVARDR